MNRLEERNPTAGGQPGSLLHIPKPNEIKWPVTQTSQTTSFSNPRPWPKKEPRVPDSLSLNDRVLLRGELRRGHSFGRSNGRVDWFVPEGAEFDIADINSTRALPLPGAIALDRQSSGYHDWAEHLAPYHRRADELYYEELEDWDIAPMRPRASNYYGESFDEQLDNQLRLLEEELETQRKEHDEWLALVAKKRRLLARALVARESSES